MLWDLFITFFLIGAFSFGGGYAMLPLLHEDCVERKKWITEEEMLDMLLDWIKNDPRGEEYRDLDWSKEYDLARNGDPNDTQTAL